MKNILLILSLLVLSSCFDSGSIVRLKENDIEFLATPIKYENKFTGGYKVSGKLEIINNSSGVIEFSNQNLYLVILNEGESRTYVNSIASHTIDFSTIKIEKGHSLKQNVYWVLPPVKSLKAEQLILGWRK